MTIPPNPTKRIAIFGIALLAALLLSACGGELGPATLRVTLLPTSEIGYEVDDEGAITVTQRNFAVHSASGSPGVTLTGYTARYFDENGAPLAGGAEANTSLAIYVPAGIRCDDPDPDVGCTLQSTNPRYAEGPAASFTVSGNQLMPVEVISEHLAAGQPAGWYALISFEGLNNFNQPFETVDYRFDIVPPN